MKTPHIVWSAAIISLVALTGLAIFVIDWTSQSNGDTHVVEDNRRAAAWDSPMAAREDGDSLGWSTVIGFVKFAGGRRGVAMISDSSGMPVVGLTGSVVIGRPQSATASGSFVLEEIDTVGGRYAFDFPFSEPGQYYVDLTVGKGPLQYAKRVRIEI